LRNRYFTSQGFIVTEATEGELVRQEKSIKKVNTALLIGQMDFVLTNP